MPKKLFETYWFSVYQTERNFIYGQRKGIHSTAALLFKKDNNGKYYFMLHHQPLPLLKDGVHKQEDVQLFPCCITGSIEKDETPDINILKEVYEEGGYKITNDNIAEKIEAVATTQMNEIVYHYLIDVTDMEITNNPCGDGSFFETVCVNKWVDENEFKELIFKQSDLFLSSLSVCYCLFLKHINKK